MIVCREFCWMFRLGQSPASYYRSSQCARYEYDLMLSCISFPRDHDDTNLLPTQYNDKETSYVFSSVQLA